jgi:hypothetical protein
MISRVQSFGNFIFELDSTMQSLFKEPLFLEVLPNYPALKCPIAYTLLCRLLWACAPRTNHSSTLFSSTSSCRCELALGDVTASRHPRDCPAGARPDRRHAP